MWRYRWTLSGGSGKARIGMCGWGFARPGTIAFPIGQWRRRIAFLPFPPWNAIVRNGHVSIDGVSSSGLHGVGVGLVIGPWDDTEETGFRIYGPQSPVFPYPHPCNVISHRAHFIALVLKRTDQHCKVGFAAGAWESCRE